MSEPELRLYKGRYYAFYSIGRRSLRRSSGTANRAEAKAWFKEWKALGGHLEGSQDAASRLSSRITVDDLWPIYVDKHVRKNLAAPDSSASCWKNLQPHFGPLTLSEIDQDVVEDYERARLAGEIGRASIAATVRKELIALRACLNWHAAPRRGRERIVDKADVPSFDLPTGSGPRERWLTQAEIKTLLAAAHDPDAARLSRGERFIWLALETAARRQAILELTWDRVDLDAGVIHYAVPGKRSTKKRRAAVPISRALRPILLRAKQEAIGPLVMDHAGDIWPIVQKIVVRSGIAARVPGKLRTGISPHTFRHTAATHMARNGVSLWAIAKILGNSMAMVEQVYAKWAPDDAAGTVDRISSLSAAE